MTTTPTAPEAGGAPAPTEEANANIPVQTSEAAPLVVATDEPPAEAPTAEAAEQPADGADAGKKGAPPKLPDWAQKEMAKKAFEAREATRRAKELEDELAKFKGAKPVETVATPPTPVDIDAAVQAEVTRREQAARAQADQEAFDAASNATFSKGVEAYKDADFKFEAAVQNLQAVGVMNRDFLDTVLASEDPAKVLYELGSDPDRAAQLMALSPAKRAMEIAKISLPAPEKKAEPVPISRAPRPVSPVEGSARPSGEPQDSDDDVTWFAKRNAQLRQRGAA